jgi:N6-adenosine-specific RNA methylase IME4
MVTTVERRRQASIRAWETRKRIRANSEALIPFSGLPAYHYASILVDPPWQFRTYKAYAGEPHSRAAERHYATMSLLQIRALPVYSLAAKDCHLWLWTPGPFLAHAIDVMEHWGFDYSTLAFTWVKLRRGWGLQQPLFLGESDLHLGTGFTTRKNCEFVLLGRRGSPRRLARDVREVIISPVREHSRKPDEIYGRIERYCAGPYIDLFARQERPGWTAWGDETSKFSTGDTACCGHQSKTKSSGICEEQGPPPQSSEPLSGVHAMPSLGEPKG